VGDLPNRTYVCGKDCPRPAGPDSERDARIDVYRDRERRRAARALDRYIDLMWVPDAAAGDPVAEEAAMRVAGERFVESVGDYVLSRLQQKSHYGASPIENAEALSEWHAANPGVAGMARGYGAPGCDCVYSTPGKLLVNCGRHHDVPRMAMDYGATADAWCECDWLGEGTPRHAPSPSCIALRPDGPRSTR
jgi:hypothetical protein